uniref:Uncharacterized protein n=1 Tax=Romanomermis culicivorax TaxID=13658 RepID=A0A915KFG2_ROMCU
MTTYNVLYHEQNKKKSEDKTDQNGRKQRQKMKTSKYT